MKTLTLNRAYLNRGEIALVIFDLSIPVSQGAAIATRRRGKNTQISMPDFDHAVLFVWPGATHRGKAHMERTAERLDGVAAEVTIYFWH